MSAVDSNYVNVNGTEVRANLKLRIVPFTATFRVLPLGHHAPVQPYVGGGVGVFGWRYSEYGQFVDPDDPSIFNGNVRGQRHATSARYSSAACASRSARRRWDSKRGGSRRRATCPRTRDLPAPKIDLGGMNYLFTFNIRF